MIDTNQGSGRFQVQISSMERNWLFVLSIAATLALSAGGLSILLLAM